MTYQTYIFDLDGTLLDSLTDLELSCNYALRANGMPERTLEEVRMFVGNGVKKLMERAVPNGLANLDHTHPYAGVEEMLQKLIASGKHVAVVSNKFYAATQELVAHFFGEKISVAIGERENIRKKPAPDTVNEALRQLGADRETAVYIGDSDVDIMTAKNSGMPCISVLWGFRSRQFLIAHGAATFVEKPSEILDI